MISDTWKKFRGWWDRQKRPEVEAQARRSVLGQLAKFKKQVSEETHTRTTPTKNRGMDRD